MLKSLWLQGIGPVKDLEATFGERLNVLTGDNGLGKSFLLDTCFWALTGSWPGGRVALPDRNGLKRTPTITYQPVGKKGPTPKPKTATFNFHNQSWIRERGRPVMPGLVVYAAVDGGFVVWDPARNYWRDPASGLTEETEQPRAYQFSPETLANGLTEGSRVLCKGLIDDWVKWYYQQESGTGTATTPPIELLEQVVHRLAHPQEPMTPGKPRRVYLDDIREFPTVDMPYGNVAFPHLSAGVRRIVSLAYLIVWAWTEHCQAAELRRETPENRIVLLVDEIEAHLHPKWQRVILPSLMSVATGLGLQIQLQIITATHSPLVLASLEPLFDEDRDRLFLFDLRDGTVTFASQPWAVRGDVVGWLTSELFGLRQARSREAEQAIEAAEAYMRGERKGLPQGLRTKEEIEEQLRALLPGLDPFWPRWVVKVQHAAVS